ncbi:MAG: endonuclease Q family protein [Bacilli bacterium]
MTGSASATRRFFVDGHVHIGRASQNEPIKISAAPSLTVMGVVEHAVHEKGIDMIGLIDAVTPPVLRDLRQLVDTGVLHPVAGGGLSWEGKVTLLLGAEVEIGGPRGGAAHFGVFFPNLETLGEFSRWLGARQTNPNLSSQRAQSTTATDLATEVNGEGGIVIVNHAFTPHKGLYGNCVAHMAEMLPPSLVSAVELGLSSDTEMADRISELATTTFVTNSDAHSLPKIAREYHIASLREPSFRAYSAALRRTGEERIEANVGLWPPLGKYHLSACQNCGRLWENGAAGCPDCGSQRFTMGVWNRLQEVADLDTQQSPLHRPPYRHHVPLQFVPGLGPAKRKSLLAAFQTEMNILNDVSVEDLIRVVGEKLAVQIDQARTGNMTLISGGAGRYGKVASAERLS